MKMYKELDWYMLSDMNGAPVDAITVMVFRGHMFERHIDGKITKPGVDYIADPAFFA